MAPTRQGPGRPHLLGRLRRTQRPGGVGADGRGEESCILGGGACRACRACRAGCAASHPGKKAGAAWNEWDREPLPGYKSCDLEMTWEGQSRHLKLKQKQARTAWSGGGASLPPDGSLVRKSMPAAARPLQPSHWFPSVIPLAPTCVGHGTSGCSWEGGGSEGAGLGLDSWGPPASDSW